MKKNIISFVLAILIANVANGQNVINQKDNKNQKTGLWIENTQYGLTEAYYQNGQFDGFFRSYSSKNGMKLSVFGNYKQGKMIGNWYFSDEKSQIYMSCEGMKPNRTVSVIGEDNKKLIPENSGYVRLYHSNGKVKAEGLAIFEDIEVDFYKMGKWVYRDKLGKEVKSEKFSVPTLVD